MRWWAGLVVVTVVTLAGCASSGSHATGVKEEMRLGAQAAARGYWQEALFRFSRAQVGEPGNAEVLNNLAVALEALGRYDEALATYKQALQAAPHDPSIRRNYARFAEFYTSYARGVLPKAGGDARR